MRHIKDYINLHTGCRVQTVDDIINQEQVPETAPIVDKNDFKINMGLYFPDVWTKTGNLEPNGINVYYPDQKKIFAMNFNQVKPILYPLSLLTPKLLNAIMKENFAPDFAKHIIETIHKSDYNFYLWISRNGTRDVIPDLLHNHFDVFRLIDDGLAVAGTLDGGIVNPMDKTFVLATIDNCVHKGGHSFVRPDRDLKAAIVKQHPDWGLSLWVCDHCDKVSTSM